MISSVSSSEKDEIHQFYNPKLKVKEQVTAFLINPLAQIVADYVTSLPSFDPTSISDYGTPGQDTLSKMVEVLKKRSLSIAYEKEARIFTILGKSKIDKETIETIFRLNGYGAWKPHVLNETDAFGNRLVKLIWNESYLERNPMASVCLS